MATSDVDLTWYGYTSDPVGALSLDFFEQRHDGEWIAEVSAAATYDPNGMRGDVTLGRMRPNAPVLYQDVFATW